MAPQAADSWQQMAAMPTVRYSHASAVMDSNIYVSGGFTTLGELSDAFEAYDPVTNAWATLASLSKARAFHASAAAHGKLYVFGGFTSSGDCLDLVEAACTYTDSNSAIQPCVKYLGTRGGYALRHRRFRGSRALRVS